MGRDQLQTIAHIVSDRMEEHGEFLDVYVSDRVVGFGYEGVQYSLAFWFDDAGYNAVIDNYEVELRVGSLAIGRMLRGDFSDLLALVNPHLKDVP